MPEYDQVPEPIASSLAQVEKSFDILETVAKGQNGYVYIVRNRITNNALVIKYYYWDKSVYHVEPRLLAQVSSPHLARVLHAELVSEDYALFHMPLYSNGDMDGVIARRPSTHSAIGLAMDVLGGTAVLHGNDLIHRDLKPANILIDQSQRAVIGDFGSVRRIPAGESSVPASGHSLIYRPPEAVATERYGRAGDLYQAGVVLYQLLGGSLPYEANSWLTRSEIVAAGHIEDEYDRQLYVDQCIKARIHAGRVVDSKTLPAWVHPSVATVVRRATRVDPGRRYPSASEMMAELNNASQRSLDWQPTDTGVELQLADRRVSVDIDGQVARAHQDCGRGWRGIPGLREATPKAVLGTLHQRYS